MTGYRELMRDMGGASGDFGKDMRAALKDALEPVRRDAGSRAAMWDSRTAAGYRVSVTTRGAFVRQSVRKTTGTRPDYGSLQMREALEPALDANASRIVGDIEDAIDRTLRRHRL